jgi:hypothetical protein
MVFSRFLSLLKTPGTQKNLGSSEIKCMVVHLNREDVQFTDFTRKNAENGKIISLKSYFEKTDFWSP